MKAVKVLFFTAVLLLGVNTAMAQAKLGHIDVATLISLMPETKKSQHPNGNDEQRIQGRLR